MYTGYMKICTKCKQQKETSLFPKMSARKDGLASWCKKCYAELAAAKYKNDPNERARKERNKAKAIQQVRETLWNYFLEHPCIDCGNSDPRVLEFDHRDELAKTRNVAEMFGWSWKSIQKEIDKCDVRCANCHRIRTQLQFGSWRGKM